MISAVWLIRYGYHFMDNGFLHVSFFLDSAFILPDYTQGKSKKQIIFIIIDGCLQITDMLFGVV